MRLRTRIFQTFLILALPICGAWAGDAGDALAPTYADPPAVQEPMPSSEPIQPSFSYDEPAPAATGANCTITCYRPVQKTREVVCERRVCKYRDEVRTCKKPVYRCETKSRDVTCWKNEYETQYQRVTRCENVIDENGCCVPQQITCEVPCQVLVRVPYTVTQEYQVVTCDWEEVEYTVKVPYWDTEEFTTTQTYCEYEAYEVQVPVCQPTCNPGCCATNPCAKCMGGMGKSRWWL